MNILSVSTKFLVPSHNPLKYTVRYTRLDFRKKYIKPRKQRNTNGTRVGDIYLRAIGTGAVDQPSTALLSTRSNCYLFNCTENTSRYLYANEVSPSRINHIFITQSKWNCIGGLTTIIFNVLAKCGQYPQFHGPETLFKITQRLTFLSSVGGMFKRNFKPDNFNSSDFFENDEIRVDFVKLKNGDDCVYGYICKVKANRGTFSLEKSVARNIPAGELLLKIFNGEEITLEDGTIVKPDEVRHQSFAEKYFMVIDVPSKDFLPDLKRNKRIEEILKDVNLELLVHFTPKSVYEMPEYQEIISKLNAQRHSLMNDSNEYSALPNVHRLQTVLHSVDPLVHPLLGMRPDPSPTIYNPSQKDCHSRTPQLYTKYFFQWMKDKKSIDPDDFDYDFTLEQATEEIRSSEQNKVNLHAEPIIQRNIETYPHFVFLGTGSAASMYDRNSTGILVHISEYQSILLDCGEGICSQIQRFYGHRAPLIFRRIKAVFVSHMHLDHHIGLPELFRMRQLHLPTRRPPLLILCPIDNLKSWLQFYSKNVEFIYPDMKMIPNCLLTENGLNRKHCKDLGISSLRTCEVPHNDNSSAVSFEIPMNGDRFKLTYSGDTAPNENLTKLGLDSTLLIHEATFQNELEEKAAETKHSTISQALKQAHDSNSKYTILTHFSGRYGKIPYVDDGTLPKNVGIAFDNMEVTVDDFPRLNGLFPKYRQVFAGQLEELEKKTNRYKMSFDAPKLTSMKE